MTYISLNTVFINTLNEDLLYNFGFNQNFFYSCVIKKLLWNIKIIANLFQFNWQDLGEWEANENFKVAIPSNQE